jgi:hypothetical protein
VEASWGGGLSADEEALLAQARQGAEQGGAGGLVSVEDAFDEHPVMLALVSGRMWAHVLGPGH